MTSQCTLRMRLRKMISLHLALPGGWLDEWVGGEVNRLADGW